MRGAGRQAGRQLLPGQPMARAGDDMEELRQGVEEVQHLWDKEEQHGFAEMPKDAHHSEGHASKIAEGVAHKHPGWVPAFKHSRHKLAGKEAAKPKGRGSREDSEGWHTLGTPMFCPPLLAELLNTSWEDHRTKKGKERDVGSPECIQRCPQERLLQRWLNVGRERWLSPSSWEFLHSTLEHRNALFQNSTGHVCNREVQHPALSLQGCALDSPSAGTDNPPPALSKEQLQAVNCLATWCPPLPCLLAQEK